MVQEDKQMNWNGLELPESFFHDDNMYIIHGDCQDVLPALPNESVSLILTDPQFFLPPPGHNTKGDTEWCGSLGDLAMFESSYRSIFQQIKRLVGYSGQVYICCHDRSYPSFYRLAFPLWPKVSMLIWYKPTGRVGNGWRRSHELVIHMAGKDTKYADGFRLDVVGIMPVWTMKRGHPAEKPGELGDFILEAVEPDRIALDPFMGSGTFPLAFVRKGLPAIGIEIEEKYCEAATIRYLKAKAGTTE